MQPLYVTPGKDEINIKIYEDVDFKDKVMSLHFAGNKKTGKGDLNAMFSGLEVITVGQGTAVDPKSRLTSTGGYQGAVIYNSKFSKAVELRFGRFFYVGAFK